MAVNQMELANLKIRPSTQSDRNAIADIHADAFGPEQGPEIVELVDGIFNDPTAQPILSLIAEIDDVSIGHVFFTLATVVSNSAAISARILAPLSVKNGYQRKGIGRSLIKNGITRLAENGVSMVFVLGDPAYYSTVGFHPANPLGLAAPYAIPEKFADAWMVQPVAPGGCDQVSGVIRCCDVLSDRKHWISEDTE